MGNQQHQQSSFTISEAAKLYSKDRTTVFKDTKRQNGLSTHKERRGSRDVAVVNLAELIRFYGEPPNQQEGNKESTADQQSEKRGESKENQSLVVSMELKLLEERLQHEQQLREIDRNERQREKQQLEEERDRAIEQADHWRRQFEQQNLLLTDERSKLEKAQAEKDRIVSKLEETKSQPKKSWWKLWS